MGEKLKEQKEMLEQQFNLKLQELKQILVDIIAKSNQKETKLSELPNMVVLNRKFEMKNLAEKEQKIRTLIGLVQPCTHMCVDTSSAFKWMLMGLVVDGGGICLCGCRAYVWGV